MEFERRQKKAHTSAMGNEKTIAQYEKDPLIMLLHAVKPMTSITHAAPTAPAHNTHLSILCHILIVILYKDEGTRCTSAVRTHWYTRYR